MKTIKHLMIPDPQCKPGGLVNHLSALGNYIVDKLPDVIIAMGDWWDMPDLSSYDKKTLKSEGRRYQNDIDAGIRGMEALMRPLVDYNNKIKKYNKRHSHKKRLYKPRLIFLIGNHEYRIVRHVNANPELKGKLSYKDLKLESFGWEVYDFLEIVTIDGVSYSHYFYAPMTGRAYGGTTHTKLNKIGFSFVQGHVQGQDTAIKALANGKIIRGLVSGSFYQHDEDYRGYQANVHFRGCNMLHEVKDGNYSLMEISLSYLLNNWDF